MVHYIKLLTIFIWKFAIFWSWQLAMRNLGQLAQRHFLTFGNRLTATIFQIFILSTSPNIFFDFQNFEFRVLLWRHAPGQYFPVFSSASALVASVGSIGIASGSRSTLETGVKLPRSQMEQIKSLSELLHWKTLRWVDYSVMIEEPKARFCNFRSRLIIIGLIFAQPPSLCSIGDRQLERKECNSHFHSKTPTQISLSVFERLSVVTMCRIRMYPVYVYIVSSSASTLLVFHVNVIFHLTRSNRYEYLYEIRENIY